MIDAWLMKYEALACVLVLLDLYDVLSCACSSLSLFLCFFFCLKEKNR